jgi:hypothetical protein
MLRFIAEERQQERISTITKFQQAICQAIFFLTEIFKNPLSLKKAIKNEADKQKMDDFKTQGMDEFVDDEGDNLDEEIENLELD